MTTTKHISTSHEQEQCDICGRTLLRGEHADKFVDGPHLHSVCELCEKLALQEGWVRANSVTLVASNDENSKRRRSRFSRRSRAQSDDGRSSYDAGQPQSLDDELSGARPTRRGSKQRQSREASASARLDAYDDFQLDVEPYDGGVMPVDAHPREIAQRDRGVRAPRPEPAREAREEERPKRRRHSSRDSQQVHAVPIDAEQKIEAAIDAFNQSQFPRIIAGLGRSLGAPNIEVRPDQRVGTVVWVLVLWELCWYRYEIELSTDPGHVRQDAQGDELSELGDYRPRPNARVERDGRLTR